MSKPQKVISCSGKKAVVDFDGKKRTVSTPIRLEPGEYVLCSAGIVAKKVSPKDAEEMLAEWGEMNDF